MRLCCGATAAVAVALLGFPAEAAQMLVPRIDSFGPYKLGMTLDQAKAAHKGGKLGACGEIAADRQCLVLDAAVFDEPGVIYAVLDPAGAKVERIVAQLDPQLTQRRAYRCVRLSEKVFALLAVVYGSKYKQSYDEKRRPLPAVAWDGEISGRLIFETKCRTADEGNPRISVVAHQPEGVEPPKVAEQAAPKPAAPVLAAPAPGTLPPGNALPPALSPVLSTAPPTAQASAPAAPREDGPLSIDAPGINPQAVAELPASISLAEPEGTGRATLGPEAPVPARAPIGVVEEIRPDTSGAVAADAGMARLARELAQAKGKAPAVPSAAPAMPAAAAVPVSPAAPAPAQAQAQAQVQPRTQAQAQAASKIPAPVAAPVQAASALPAAAPKPVQSVDSAVAARLAPPPAAAALPQAPPQTVQAVQTAALPPARPVRPHYADELPEPPDMVAPEPFMVPEEEEVFRQRRDAAAPPNGAASAPFALLSVSPPAARSEPQSQPQPLAQPQTQPQAAPPPSEPAPVVAPARAVAATPPGDPKPAASPAGRGPAPVLTGGWRHRAPVPPARPWRDRTDMTDPVADPGAS